MFAEAQAHYAERGIATFPVTDAKRPAIRGYLRTGLAGSEKPVAKFPDAPGVGFATDSRNRISVLDIDSDDERVLTQALDRHGQTPLIVRTASGKFHAYYRHNGERRQIRPWQGRDIDLLGSGGMVVCPPSKLANGQYEFIEGGLDDIGRLPILRGLDELRKPGLAARPSQIGYQGKRNISLFEHCMRQAHYVDDLDTLIDVAQTYNRECQPALEDKEVLDTAKSAWNYTEKGQNRFGQHGAWIPFQEMVSLDGDVDAFWLLAWLRAYQGPGSTFLIANGLTDRFGWSRERVRHARRRLIELGHIKVMRQAGRGTPALYRWAS
jgi:hypothetical protein